MTNRIELRITERIPFADGHGFGDVGAYERLSGRAHFAVDPHAAAQAGVVDLDKAPRDDSGLVRFAADFMILKPREMQRGNRRVFYDYGNRGHKRALQFFNDAPHSNAPITLAHAGNGFFMRRGYAVAWLAWEGDMLPGDGRMVLDVPVASDNGRPITGRIRVEYIADVAGHHLLPAQRQDRGAFLCRRLARHARRGADAAALSIRHAAGHSARPVALRLRRVRRRRRDAVGGTRRGAVRAAHLPAGRVPARLDL